jgi:hypothetical protein
LFAQPLQAQDDPRHLKKFEFELRMFAMGQKEPALPMHKATISKTGELASSHFVQQYDFYYQHAPVSLECGQLVRIKTTLDEQDFQSLPSVIGIERRDSYFYTISVSEANRRQTVGLFVAPDGIKVDSTTARFLTCWRVFYDLLPDSQATEEEVQQGKVNGVALTVYAYKKYLGIPFKCLRR